MPHCTSSKISSRPCLSQSARSACRNSGRQRRDAALALHRLDHDRRRSPAPIAASTAVEVAERHVVEAVGTGGPKPSRYFALPPAAMVASVRPWNEPLKVMMRQRSGLPLAK